MKLRSTAVTAAVSAAAALAATGITYASAASAPAPQQAPAVAAPAAAPAAPAAAPDGGSGGGNGNNNNGKGNEGKGNEGRGGGGGHRYYEGRIEVNERSYSAHAGDCITVVSGLGARSLNIRNDTRRTVEVFRGAVCDNGAPIATVGPRSSANGVRPGHTEGVGVEHGVVASFRVVRGYDGYDGGGFGGGYGGGGGFGGGGDRGGDDGGDW
ncbi:hypothetical protein FNH09_21280 [Streptomyces adustus]|uniref:Uncharacterized protein n=1 Tax=Streptomyces adustus TaxID=1609272 RepID=A0A5N8VHX2_9ACTN|nr:hypothetical protein [Streptomyces adustus]MPY33684.1 hypothetical protein [Streptomyces adustus]